MNPLQLRGEARAAPRPDPDLLELRVTLINRYGLLFRGRKLVCADCLGGGIRWGEVKKSRRRNAALHHPDDGRDEASHAANHT